PMEVWESADHIVSDPAQIVWYHRNEDSVVPLSIKHQGLEPIAATIPDILLHRTFGGVITVAPDGAFRKSTPTTSSSNGPRARFDLRIAGHTEQTPTPEAWIERASALAADAPDTAAARQRTAEWWADFWN